MQLDDWNLISKFAMPALTSIGLPAVEALYKKYVKKVLPTYL